MGKPLLRYLTTENIPEWAIMQWKKTLIVLVINQLENVQSIHIIIQEKQQQQQQQQQSNKAKTCI